MWNFIMLMKINIFSESFLQGTMFSFLENFFRCDYFCINRRDEKNHNFLTHYQLGGRQPSEDKPLKKTLFDENLKDTIYICWSMERSIL